MTTLTENNTLNAAGHPAGALDLITQTFRKWIRSQQLRSKLAQERRQLMGMSDRMLQDLGISRAEAGAESARTDIPLSRLSALGWN